MSIRTRLIIPLVGCIILLAGCSTGQALPANWPKIGLTLPGRAEIKKLSPAFQKMSSDDTWAYSQDGPREMWAVDFSSPGGIVQAEAHFDNQLSHRGFTLVEDEDFPFELRGGVTGSRGAVYRWVSADKTTGVALATNEGYGAKSRELYGELCLVVTRVSKNAQSTGTTKSTPQRPNKTNLF